MDNDAQVRKMLERDEQLAMLEKAIASNDHAQIQAAVVPVLLGALGDLRRIADAQERIADAAEKQANAQEFLAAIAREDIFAESRR